MTITALAFLTVSLVLVNFFVKSWALSASAFFVAVGVVLTSGDNQWLQYGFIIVMVWCLLSAVDYGFKKV
jgi:hypothetical protein